MASSEASGAPDRPDSTDVGKQQVLWRFYSAAAAGLFLVACFFASAPAPTGAACEGVSLLWMIRNARSEGTLERVFACATEYRRDHEGFLLTGFVLLYTTLQSFAIPSSVVLSILSGALYDFKLALPLVLCCATTGASVCYTISKGLGGGLLAAFKLEKHLVSFREKVDEKRREGGLFSYMVVSRITPMPNLVINLASPLLGIPLHTFVPGTFFGLIPLTSMHIASGKALATVGKVEKGPVVYVFAAGALVLAVMFFRDRRAKKARQLLDDQASRKND